MCFGICHFPRDDAQQISSAIDLDNCFVLSQGSPDVLSQKRSIIKSTSDFGGKIVSDRQKSAVGGQGNCGECI